jgi:hypothetical protein
LVQAKVSVESSAAVGTEVFCNLSGPNNNDTAFATLSPIDIATGQPTARTVLSLLTFTTTTAANPFVTLGCIEEDSLNANPVFSNPVVTAVPVGTVTIQ